VPSGVYFHHLFCRSPGSARKSLQCPFFFTTNFKSTIMYNTRDGIVQVQGTNWNVNSQTQNEGGSHKEWTWLRNVRGRWRGRASSNRTENITSKQGKVKAREGEGTEV
jgi:hypothetical protein